jgi:hypothetical protein
LRRSLLAWSVLSGVLVLVLMLVSIFRSPGLAEPAVSRQSRSGAASAALSATVAYLPAVSRDYGSGVYPNCRFGVAASGEQLGEFDIVANLNAGWYMDFWARETPVGPPEAEYAQMIHLGQDRGGSDDCGPPYSYTVSPTLTALGLGARVDANPGALWLVGNEPDRIYQNDICPQQYAEAYHDVYYFIKERDPTAQVAMAGLVEVTPGRLQYLDIVWDTYRERYGTDMPVDVWTMHIYVLSETNDGDAHIALGTDPGIAIPFSFDCPDANSYCHAEHDDMDLFVGQVVAMREWMWRHGQQDHPLLITEFGLLKPYNYYGLCAAETCPPPDGQGCFCDENNETFHPVRVADFMEATFDYLLTVTDARLGNPHDNYRLVQQWLWYSLATDPLAAGHASNVAVPDDGYALTAVGQRWQDYVSAIPPEVNLMVQEVPPVVVQAPGGTDPVTVTLSALVLNNGNTAADGTVTLTFYSDEALTTPIGSATFTGLWGCARPVLPLTTTWESLSAGVHHFWAVVDSTGAVAETSEADNVGHGIVLVNPSQLYLPLALR